MEAGWKRDGGGMEAGGKRDGGGMEVGWKGGAGVNVVNTAVLTTLRRK